MAFVLFTVDIGCAFFWEFLFLLNSLWKLCEKMKTWTQRKHFQSKLISTNWRRGKRHCSCNWYLLVPVRKKEWKLSCTSTCQILASTVAPWVDEFCDMKISKHLYNGQNLSFSRTTVVIFQARNYRLILCYFNWKKGNDHFRSEEN